MASQDSKPPIDTFGRVPEYIEMLEEARLKGECLLDIEGFRARSGEDILHELGGWILARTLYPYPNTIPRDSGAEGHTLIFPERHITSPKEMNSEDIKSAWQLFNDASEIFGAKTGALFFRYSNEGNHVGAGATIDHVHIHVIAPFLEPETGRVPGANSPNTKQVKLWVG